MKDNDTRIGKYLESSGIPVFVFTPPGEIVYWNHSAVQLFPEMAPDSGGPRDIRTVILRHVSPETRIRLKYLFESKTPHFEIEFPGGDRADRHWFRMSVSLQSDGNRLAIVRDVTAQKIKERHLMLAKETAEKASLSRSQFLANISHEIRTPIQTIIGMMELLADTKLDEEQTEYSRQVRFSADVMLTLINDILDFSKVEAGQLKIEAIDFDLSDVVERTVDLISMEAHKKGIEICVGVDPSLPDRVQGDPGRIQQILLNLVKNAVKFTAQGQILVTAEPRARETLSMSHQTGEVIHFEVTDSGIGIPDEVKNRLFTQFVQADSSTTRKYGGTGLGLAISKNLVSLMEGEIGVRDNPAGGSVFWFNLPLVPSKEQNPREALQLDPATRFLIVDDNPFTLEFLTRMLGSLGYRDVARESSGSKALARLSTASREGKPFDIVLIDMIMPEMDGWRLAAEINGNREINQAQLYLMVPEGTFGADAKMKLLDWFNGYLYKPVKQRRLVELLREHWQASIDLEVVEEAEEMEEVEEAPPAEIEAVPPPVNLTGLRVLVAEDHPVNSKLLKIFLEKAGATVHLAEDGQYATEIMEKEAVDLVFMDIQMPRMNGYEAAAWMRKRNYPQPIIACTASAQENERERCVSYGMNDILPKPYKREDVYRAVRRHVPAPEGDPKPVKAETEKNDQNPETFNAREYLEIMGGDAEIASSLVDGFIEQTTRHLKALRESLAKGSFEEGRRTAHLIKGSALNITANRFAQTAKDIECAPPDLEAQGFAERYRAAVEAYRELREALRAAYPSRGSGE